MEEGERGKTGEERKRILMDGEWGEYEGEHNVAFLNSDLNESNFKRRIKGRKQDGENNASEPRMMLLLRQSFIL